MRKGFWIGIGLAIIVLVGVGVFVGRGKVGKKEPEVIKIGAILPLTGDVAILGEEVKKGMEIAEEEAKNEGINIRIIYEDDQSLSPVAAVNAANKLIQQDKIKVGLTMLVEESRPIAPIFNRAKVPLIVLWDSNRFIKEAGEYIFSNGFSTEKAGEIMGKFAYFNLKLRKVAIVKHVDPWAEIISESFENAFREAGGTVVYKETFQPTETDYRTSIAKIKKMKVDGIYFALIPPNSALFLKQVRELNLPVTLLTGDALIQDVIDAAGEAAEGVYFTNIFTEPKKASMLTEKYEKKYGKSPIDVTLVSFGYDGIMLVIKAIRMGKPLKEALITILGEDRSADRVEKIYRVVKGRPKEVEIEPFIGNPKEKGGI